MATPVISRIGHFVASTAWEVAWDVFVPDYVQIPVKIAKNFYHHFLATPPAEQQELLAEAAKLSDKEAEAVANDVVAEWKQAVGADLPAEAKSVVKELVESLRIAGRGSPNVPGEALRLSLNRSRLTAGHPIPPIALSAEQQSVGQLLRTTQSGRGPSRPVPTGFAIPGYQFLRTLGRGGFASEGVN